MQTMLISERESNLQELPPKVVKVIETKGLRTESKRVRMMKYKGSVATVFGKCNSEIRRLIEIAEDAF